MEKKCKKEMVAQEVLNVYDELEKNGILVWIDGGWAVDALKGEKTRPHEDLDIAVFEGDLENVKKFLELKGYESFPRAEDKMWDLVMRNEGGYEIEVHTFTCDKNGKVKKQPYWDGYEAGSLDGVGAINGRSVRCVSVAQLLKTKNANFRTLKVSDYQDIETLRSLL